MLRIGQFSKLAQIPIKTLRYYDKIGLLKPAMTDTSSSYRYYTSEQLQTAYLIATYKAAGLSNDTIRELLAQNYDRRILLESQKQVLLRQIDSLHKNITVLDSLLDAGKQQSYTATVKHVDKQLVYCCRGYVPSAEHIHDFVKACTGELQKTNPEVKFSEPDYCCVVYPDDGYRESNIFIEYAQSVDRVGKDTDTLKFKELEPITAISVLHYGSYDNLRDAYLFAVNWAKEQGYTLVGEPRERYIDGAWNKADISQWLTELQLPAKEGL